MTDQDRIADLEAEISYWRNMAEREVSNTEQLAEHAEQYRRERDMAFGVIRNTLVALEAQSTMPQMAGALRILIRRIDETGTITGQWPPSA